MNTKTLYFMTRIAFVAMFAMGLLLVPAFNSTGTVSAQKGQRGVAQGDTEDIKSQQIARALRLGAATDAAVFAENGVSNKGVSTVKGQVMSLTDSGETGLKVRRSLSDSFSAINQLECTQLADTDLTGKTFGPGVYCMESARLAGQLVLDGQGNTNGNFIFRVKGNLDAEKGSIVSVIGDAIANNVYFVADDSAAIGEGANFKGSVFARNSIVIGDNTIVDGRTLSLKGDVDLGANTILGPQQTGVLQICKTLDTTFGTGLEGRVFQYQIGGANGQIVEAVAGQCSRQITVASGTQSIEELLTGRTTSGGTFNGNFQLIAVNPLGFTDPAVITNRNLPARTVSVTIPTNGTTANQVRVEFVNRFAITGIVEICKQGLDNGVDTFFNFSIDAVTFANGTPVTFVAPTGQCTGPISVTLPSIDPNIVNNGTPRTGVVNVTEQFRQNAILADGFTATGTIAPTNRFLGLNLTTRTIRGIVVEGGATSQTTFFFVNRTVGLLKICKVGTFGVPEFTPFTFLVSGTGPTFASGVNGNDPGTATATTVTVLAGTPLTPICEEVPLVFLGGTNITITELTSAVSTGPGSVETRVSRITSSSGFTPTAGTASLTATNPVQFNVAAPGIGQFIFPAQTGAASTRTIVVPVVGNGTVEVEFTNIAFLPVPIKICKIAGGTGSLLGTSFSFTATTGSGAEDPNNVLPTVTSASVSVTAGPGGIQNGFCNFVAGPAGTPTINGLGSFNLFTPVTITEAASAGTTVTSIFSPNNTPAVNANLATRSAFIQTLFNGVNEVTFVNAAAVAALPNKTKRFRMQF